MTDGEGHERIAAGDLAIARAALESESPRELLERVAKAVRTAVSADSSAVVLSYLGSGPLSGAVDGILTDGTVALDGLQAALHARGSDNSERDTAAAIEAWAVRECGMQGAAIGRTATGANDGTATIVAMTASPRSWLRKELVFIERAANVTWIAAGQLRTRAISECRAKRIAAETQFFASDGDYDALGMAAAATACEIDTRFGVHCLAIVAADGVDDGPSILWKAEGVDIPLETLEVVAGEVTPSNDQRGQTALRLGIRAGDASVGQAFVEVEEGAPDGVVRELQEAFDGLGALIVQRERLAGLAMERRAMETGIRLAKSLTPVRTLRILTETFAEVVCEHFAADTLFVMTPTDTGFTLGALHQRDGRSAGQLGALDGEAPALEAMCRAVDTAAVWKESDTDEPTRRLTKALGARSIMVAPVEGAEGARMGLIVAANARPGAWQQRDAHSLGDFAAMLGLMVERQQLIDSQRRRDERLQTLVHEIASIEPDETFRVVMDRLCRRVRRMYGADHCAVALREPGQHTLIGVDSTLVTGSLIGPELDDSIPYGSYGERGYQAIPDVVAMRNEHPVLAQMADRGVGSLISALAGTPDTPVATITVAWRRRLAASEAAAWELREITHPIAMSVSYFASRLNAEQRMGQLEIVNAALGDMAAGGTPEELAVRFLEACRDLIRIAHGYVVQVEPATGRPIVLAELHPADEPADSHPRLGEASLRTLVQCPEARSLTLGELDPAERDALRKAGVGTGVVAPLPSEAGPRGVAILWRKGGRRIDVERLALLTTLKRPLGIALAKAETSRALTEGEAKYRSLIAQAEESILLFDVETWDLLEFNSYAARMMGYSPEEMEHINARDLIEATPGQFMAETEEIREAGVLRMVDQPYRRRDGSTVMMDVVGSIITVGGRQAVLIMGRDVTERAMLQQRLIQGQKMEALGAMAGNVAHDFNNMLTTVLGFAGLLKRAPEMSEETLEQLGLIEDAARRASDISSRLLTFARGGLVRFGPVDMRAVVEETLRLAQAGLPATIEVRTRLSSAPAVVEGDAGQLQQAILNIIINARDAMPEGGTLTVRLWVAGDGCLLSIADTGTGMSEESRLRMFEPFYTTKPIGQGTGLGMAITYGVVEAHHGSISVTTTPGRGTTFTINLPLIDESAAQEAVPAVVAGPAAAAAPADERVVLVVDDDHLVRRTVAAILLELGYRVETAGSGTEALDMVTATPGRFTAVVLDLMMAGMSGAATFRELKAVRADLPIVICTGFVDHEQVDDEVRRGAAGVVHKPFTADGLARALQLAGAFPGR